MKIITFILITLITTLRLLSQIQCVEDYLSHTMLCDNKIHENKLFSRTGNVICMFLQKYKIKEIEQKTFKEDKQLFNIKNLTVYNCKFKESRKIKFILNTQVSEINIQKDTQKVSFIYKNDTIIVSRVINSSQKLDSFIYSTIQENLYSLRQIGQYDTGEYIHFMLDVRGDIQQIITYSPSFIHYIGIHYLRNYTNLTHYYRIHAVFQSMTGHNTYDTYILKIDESL